MDDVNLKGSGEIGPGVIIQDSDVSLSHNSLAGEITLVNQSFDGKDVDGKAFGDDNAVDAIAKPVEAKDAETTKYDTTGVDQSKYREHIAEMSGHAYGEVFSDTSVQAHQGDVIAGYQEGYIDKVSAAPEGTSHDQLAAQDPTAKPYLQFQKGANDGITEDIADGKPFTANGRAWNVQHDERGKAQLQGGGEAMYWQTAQGSQMTLGVPAEQVGLNPNAGAGLTTQRPDTGAQSKYQAAIDRFGTGTAPKADDKDKGMEVGG